MMALNSDQTALGESPPQPPTETSCPAGAGAAAAGSSKGREAITRAPLLRISLAPGLSPPQKERAAPHCDLGLNPHALSTTSEGIGTGFKFLGFFGFFSFVGGGSFFLQSEADGSDCDGGWRPEAEGDLAPSPN